MSNSSFTCPAFICWFSGTRFEPSVSSTVVQAPHVAARSTAKAAAGAAVRSTRRKKLLYCFIESVVIVEKVLRVG